MSRQQKPITITLWKWPREKTKSRAENQFIFRPQATAGVDTFQLDLPGQQSSSPESSLSSACLLFSLVSFTSALALFLSLCLLFLSLSVYLSVQLLLFLGFDFPVLCYCNLSALTASRWANKNWFRTKFVSRLFLRCQLCDNEVKIKLRKMCLFSFTWIRQSLRRHIFISLNK